LYISKTTNELTLRTLDLKITGGQLRRKWVVNFGDHGQHEGAGENLAVVYSLIATCEACGVNPMEYLPDVMRRISTHPASQIRELLPDRWQPARE